MDRKHTLENGKYYNPLRVQKYLDMIESVNAKAEQRIENIRKQRDDKVNTFDRFIIEEKQKPIK
jgi:hypothetical protein